MNIAYAYSNDHMSNPITPIMNWSLSHSFCLLLTLRYIIHVYIVIELIHLSLLQFVACSMTFYRVHSVNCSQDRVAVASYVLDLFTSLTFILPPTYKGILVLVIIWKAKLKMYFFLWNISFKFFLNVYVILILCWLYKYPNHA